jgi:hypothetical protein
VVRASGACADVADAGLDWGTGLSAGWSKAWGEWANDGTGDWVCQRTITYSPKLSTWVTE